MDIPRTRQNNLTGLLAVKWVNVIYYIYAFLFVPVEL